MLIYYYSKDQELKRKITIIDIILTIGILLILIVASEKTGKDFFCFMIFLTYCFFNITFSIVIYLLLKKRVELASKIGIPKREIYQK